MLRSHHLFFLFYANAEKTVGCEAAEVCRYRKLVGSAPWLWCQAVLYCWTWRWPLSRPKHVVQLISVLQINLMCLTPLHCTFLVHVTWNLIVSEFLVADWLLVSLCYWCSDRCHTDVCTQWTSCTWIWFWRTYSIRNGRHSFLNHNDLSLGFVYYYTRFPCRTIKTHLVANIIFCQT